MIESDIVESIIHFIRLKRPDLCASARHNFIYVESHNRVVISLFLDDIGALLVGTDFKVFYSDPLFFDELESWINVGLNRLSLVLR